MERRTYLKATGATALAGVTGGAGCVAPGRSDPTPTEIETAAPTEAGGDRSTRMVTEGSDYFFDPIGLFVEP